MDSKKKRRLSGEDDKENVESPLLKKCRFSFASKEQIEAASVGVLSPNTDRSNKWALSAFGTWRIERNKHFGQEEQCPESLLADGDIEALSYWLSRFVLEVRKGDGTEYPPKSLHYLLCGLQRIIRMHHPEINVFDKSNKHLAIFRKIHDNEYHRLHTKGIGANVQHCEVLTPSDEQQMWQTGVIGIHSPLAFLRAVFIFNSKNFCLRGGKEQKELKLSQIQRGFDEELGKAYYTYVENGSKNRRGCDLHVNNKTVRQYEQPELGMCCHVYLLDLYVTHLPAGSERFYRNPLSPTSLLEQWYSTDSCSNSFLDNLVKTTSQEAGIKKPLTNHSLRAGGATAMFQAGVPEKLIAERTGHRSQQSLQLFERKTNYDDNLVSAAITGAGGASAQFQAGELLGTGPVHVQLTTPPGMFTLTALSVTEVERVFDNMSLECLDWVSEDLVKELYSPF